MKLIKDTASAWETQMIEGYPFGIEKIGPRDYVVFRLWGSRRVYLRDTGFISLNQAHDYLVPMCEKYASSIITAIVSA
jgi:hypothetical protein